MTVGISMHGITVESPGLGVGGVVIRVLEDVWRLTSRNDSDFRDDSVTDGYHLNSDLEVPRKDPVATLGQRPSSSPDA